MKILAIQNKMGIGDTVIFLPFIKAISEKFNCRISLLVKESSKADQFLEETSYIDQIINLKKKDNNEGIFGSIKLAKKIREQSFEKVFIFNSSLRFNLISKLAGVKQIYQYPLFKKKEQHKTEATRK